MPETQRFDVLILGSGQGGKLLAWHLAKAGKKVAVVERRWVGGSCPAVACMPSKNEIWSAHVSEVVRTASSFGAVLDSRGTDMRRVLDRKRKMVEQATSAHLAAYRESGAELILGTGRFVGPKTVEVALNEGGSVVLKADQVVIDVGTHATMPDVPGLLAAKPLTHIEALEIDYVPRHLVVIGGGYVGIEMAQAFRRFGSEVTIVEPGDQVLAREDADVASEIFGILTDEGIKVLTGAKVARVDGLSGGSVSIALDTGGGTQVVEASDVLVAVGRTPNTAEIGLDKTGVALDDRGFVRVDERLETSSPGIWAIGECAGSPQFTHVSVDDYRIVRDNMAGHGRKADERLVPYVMFTEPPLARVGLSEAQAARQGILVRLAELPMENVTRTSATDEKRGWMKAVVSAADDRVLGFTMIGAGAGEVLAAVQTAMLAELPFQGLRDAVLTHLTFAEGLNSLFEKIPELAA